jgi:DNA-binding CsgD family transcriptional regulator
VRWPVTTLEVLDGAVAHARDGSPAVVGIEGEAGFGKSTLLREAMDRLDGFQVLRGFGEQDAQDERFALLRDWRALPEGTPPRHTVAAIRLLTRVLDRRRQDGPVALVVDDLQWIDPESVDALAALVSRAVGDRLLVLAAYRPLGRRHAPWRRLVTPAVRLDGLDAAGAADLVATLDPDAPRSLAEALRAHTGGSPLHMRALLAEHSSAELTALAVRDELPAPADLAASLADRLAQLAPESANLLSALAVLGDAWTDLPTAVAVGAVREPETAVAVLREDGLVRIDRRSVVPRIRISHAVIRAAVYEAVPEPTRRRLHGAAAARVADAGGQLRHRLAATVGDRETDEGLALDLDRHADALHEHGRFREAARFRHLAAGATASTADRERRRLDAAFEEILAHDPDDVADREPDGPHGRVVAAMRLTADRQWVRAARVLDEVTDDDLATLDPLNAYRARVLRGWTTLGAGRAAADALVPLREAAGSRVQDPALRGLFTFAYGQAVQAVTDRHGELWGFHDTMGADRAALAASPEGLVRLAWRGAAYALTGSPATAIGDLSVVTGRIDDGAMDLGDGAFHALLGLAYWTSGQWRRASITIGLAQTAPRAAEHPIVLATSPLAAVVRGDDLAPSLARSRDARLAGPLPAVLHVGDIVDVAGLAFAGSSDQRRAWLGRRTADFGDPRGQADGVVPYLWQLAMGLASSWTGDAEATEAWADALADLTRGPWRPVAVRWLRALAARLRGEAAATALVEAAGAGLDGLPAFAALLWVDAAGSAAHEGHPAAAVTRERAAAALDAVEAARYAPALLPPGALGRETADPLAPLSDREREVAALLLEGLSYTQIAEELFVTRSTVAHHLSNTYAKTGTSTRHELTRLVRGSSR